MEVSLTLKKNSFSIIYLKLSLNLTLLYITDIALVVWTIRASVGQCAYRLRHHDTHLTAISRLTHKSRYQNVSILDFIGAKDGGGSDDKCSYKMSKAPVKSSPPTNQHPASLKASRSPSSHPTNSVRSLKEITIIQMIW